MQHRRFFDCLNFLLADVRGVLGPYLRIFLPTQEHWTPPSIGLLTTVDAIVGLALNAPAGAGVDGTRTRGLRRDRRKS